MKWLTGIAIVVALVVGLIFDLLIWSLAAAILLIALWAWYLHDANSPSQRSQGLAAALSAIALLFGVYWYIIERPGAAKLDLSLAGQSFSMGSRQALVYLAVEVKNVGNTPVSFEGEAAVGSETRREAPEPPLDVDCLPEDLSAIKAEAATSVMKIRLGKVAPVAPDLRPYLACATYSGEGGPASLARADLWPPLAGIDQNLATKIESGESEKYYYRFVVPCEPRLVLSATAQIPKRATFTDTLVRKEPEGQVWIAQSLVDLTAVCGK
jgi:hypothetical protein